MGVKNEITQVGEGEIGERERQGVRERRTAGEDTVLMLTNNAEAINQSTRAPEKFQTSSS